MYNIGPDVAAMQMKGIKTACKVIVKNFRHIDMNAWPGYVYVTYTKS